MLVYVKEVPHSAEVISHDEHAIENAWFINEKTKNRSNLLHLYFYRPKTDDNLAFMHLKVVHTICIYIAF